MPDVPQGIERLLTLAAISPEWREKVLADPLKAAARAGVELSESERAILQATPRAALGKMVLSFVKKRSHSTTVKVAAGVAAGVAATGLAVVALGAVMTGATAGVRADTPPPNPNKTAEPSEASAVLWMASLDEALAEARKSNRAVMAVFPHPKPIGPLHISYEDGTSGLEVGPEWKSQKVISSASKEFRAAVKNADLVTVRATKPSPPFPLDANGRGPGEDKLFNQYKEGLAVYEAALKKYGLDEKKLPAVVFLAPDGSELAKLVQPQEEAKLIEAITAVPPLLLKWFDAHPEFKKRDIFPGPGVEVPLGGTAGIRIDIPLERGK